MSNFIQLKALAKNTVGSSCDYLIDLMLILLELYDQINSKEGELDNQRVYSGYRSALPFPARHRRTVRRYPPLGVWGFQQAPEPLKNALLCRFGAWTLPVRTI